MDKIEVPLTGAEVDPADPVETAEESGYAVAGIAILFLFVAAAATVSTKAQTVIAQKTGIDFGENGSNAVEVI